MNTGRQVYERNNRKKYLLFVGLLMVLFLFLIADVMTGPAMLPVKEVLACLFHKSGASDNTRVIVWSMRLPVALMALVVGIALGTSGSVMQTILHNPLASPYTLGVWGCRRVWRFSCYYYGLGQWRDQFAFLRIRNADLLSGLSDGKTAGKLWKYNGIIRNCTFISFSGTAGTFAIWGFGGTESVHCVLVFW